MSRTFQDHDFLVWEAYPSGSRQGFPEHPNVIFNCLTGNVRPRFVGFGADSAEAQRRIAEMSDAALLSLLETARDIP